MKSRINVNSILEHKSNVLSTSSNVSMRLFEGGYFCCKGSVEPMQLFIFVAFNCISVHLDAQMHLRLEKIECPSC